MDDQRAVFRLWDKDFNVLATWREGDDLKLTRDKNGQRWVGIVTGFTAEVDFV